MQSALGSLVDVSTQNEQEFEDELANLLGKEEPITPSPEKYIPGIYFC